MARLNERTEQEFMKIVRLNSELECCLAEYEIAVKSGNEADIEEKRQCLIRVNRLIKNRSTILEERGYV